MPTTSERLTTIRGRLIRLTYDADRNDALASTDTERAYENTIRDLINDAQFLLDSLTRARQEALQDAIRDACLYCRSRGSGFNTEVKRNDVGVYFHESHESFTALGPQIAQCKASAIHERIKLEAARDKEKG